MGNITQVGYNLFRDVLRGAVTDGKIKYMAWGTDGTANPSPNNLTQPNSEVGRKAVTSFIVGGAGILNTILYMSPEDGAGVSIKEIGFFAGDSATLTANTGIMICRFLFSRDKTALESIQFDLKDIITGS